MATQNATNNVGGYNVIATTVFSSSGTWTINKFTRALDIYIISGGGGGGSGRKGGVINNCTGGCGGAVASGRFFTFAQFMGTSHVTVTIGAGGGGGSAQSTDSTNGIAGNNGGSSSLGNFGIIGGLGGGGGAISTVTGSASILYNIPNSISLSQNSGNAIIGGPTAAVNIESLVMMTGSSGGVGGPYITTPGNAGDSGNVTLAGTIIAAGVAGGTTPSGNGNNGNATTFNFTSTGLFTGGSGGSGGASATAVAAAGKGGNGGGVGSGGGGGGAGVSTLFSSGAGGSGANGYIIIVEYQ